MTSLLMTKRQNRRNGVGSSSTTTPPYLRLCSFLFLFILAATLVTAFGIKPAQQSYAFQPYLDATGQFTIVRENAEATEAHLTAEGDLAPYLSFDQEYVALSGSETSIKYHLTLPEELPSGQQVGLIAVEEQAPEGTAIGAKVRLLYKVFVNVPYPDDYVNASIDVTASEGKLTVTATVHNWGTADLASVEPVVRIERDGKLLATLTLPARAITAGATEVFTETMDEPEQEGVYYAVADITHDNGQIEILKEFVIGMPTIALLRHTPYFKAGEVNAFNITLENQWNAPISGIIPEFSLLDNEQPIVSVRGQPLHLDKDERKSVLNYIDLRSVAPGKYGGMLTLTYPQGAEVERFPIEVLTAEDYAKKGRWSPWMVGIIILVAINAALGIVLLLRRRRR